MKIVIGIIVVLGLGWLLLSAGGEEAAPQNEEPAMEESMEGDAMMDGEGADTASEGDAMMEEGEGHSDGDAMMDSEGADTASEGDAMMEEGVDPEVQ